MSGPNVNFPVIEIVEGKTRLVIPDPKMYLREDGVFEPAWAPVFYNPRMEFCRDVAVLALRAYVRSIGRDVLVADPLAGVGARGIRYAVEVDKVSKVYINDINPEAIKLAEYNARINNVEDRVILECFDANFMLRLRSMMREKLDYIDIDPFGSPVEFLDSALSAIKIGGMICVTATDTATLCGLYPDTCLRRYWSYSGKVGFDREMGLRILMGHIVLRASSYDYNVSFKLAYYADHYFRVYFTVRKSAKEASKCVKMLKYIVVIDCRPEVLDITEVKDVREGIILGPLWTGPLGDTNFIKIMIDELRSTNFLRTKARIKQLLETLVEECNMPPYYYRLDWLCKHLHTSMPKVSEVLEFIRSRGFRAVRTHFDTRAFKTNAPYDVVVECIKSLRG